MAGRTTPASSETSSSLHPALAVPLLSIIAVLVALCASHHRKSSPRSEPPSPPPVRKSSEKFEQDVATAVQLNETPSPIAKCQEQQECQTPETVFEVTHGPIGPSMQPTLASASKRRLSMNFSMRIPEGLSRIHTSRREQKERALLEDSVWTKTIILGERCRIPSEEEDDVVIYDEKGNRKRNYHPKTPRSVSVSRTNSFSSTNDVSS